MAGKIGIIAEGEAFIQKKKPSFRGYDLYKKNPDPNYEGKSLDDYILVYDWLDAETFNKSGMLDANTVIPHLHRSLGKLYEEKQATIEGMEEAIAKQDEKPEIRKINGQVIRAVYVQNNKHFLEYNENIGDLDKITEISQELLQAWVNARVHRNDLAKLATLKLTTGTVDLLKYPDGTRRLAVHTKDGYRFEDNKIEVQRLKASLYFWLEKYKHEDRYLKELQCSGTSGIYTVKFQFEKGPKDKFGKLETYIDKSTGNLTDLELAIIRDIMKIDFQD